MLVLHADHLVSVNRAGRTGDAGRARAALAACEDITGLDLLCEVRDGIAISRLRDQDARSCVRPASSRDDGTLILDPIVPSKAVRSAGDDSNASIQLRLHAALDGRPGHQRIVPATDIGEIGQIHLVALMAPGPAEDREIGDRQRAGDEFAGRRDAGRARRRAGASPPYSASGRRRGPARSPAR